MNSNQFNGLQGAIFSGIAPYFKYYIKYNKGLNNPYHNINHALRMLHLINDAHTNPFTRDENYDFKGLCLGALFHDFNHSGGKLTDKENVKNAIQGLKDADKWVLENYGKCYKAPTSVRKRAINYIKATEYPYVIKDENLNKNQALIRDCDVLCYFAEDWFTQVLVRLAKEFNTDDYKDVLDKMESFLEDAYVLTRSEYGKMVFMSLFKAWKKEKEYYINNIL